jgi:hypothetical protein
LAEYAASSWDREQLIIEAAPWGPQWLPGDSPEEIAVSRDGH